MQTSCVADDIFGIPVWRYANGALLFATDKPETHARELLSSYLDQLSLIKSIASVMPEKLSDPGTIFDGPLHSIIEHTDYGRWYASYQSDISASKKILEERESSGVFIQCKKCGSNDVDTEQKQTRSADEPMTIFCLCKRCGKRFTMS